MKRCTKEKEIDFATIKRFLTTEKQRLQREYHVNEIGIFGSFSRGDQNKTSDIRDSSIVSCWCAHRWPTIHCLETGTL